MSGGSRNTRQPENWQPGQEYWVYVPNNHNLNGSMPLPSGFPLALGSLSLPLRGRATDSWSLFEERLFPPPPSSRPQIRPLLIGDYDMYPRSRNSMRSTPTHNYDPTRYNNQIPTHEGSKLSGEEQKRAISRLRKQLHSPHLSNIIKRLGTSNNSITSESSQPDDDWKRCAVCLEDFDTKQFLMLTPCNHMFHEECIVPWVKSQGKCPVCRFAIAEKNSPLPLGQGTIEWSQFFQTF